MEPDRQEADISRKDFLHLVSKLGGAAALASIIQACNQTGIDPTSLLSPSPVYTSSIPTETKKPSPTTSAGHVDATDPTVSPSQSPTMTPETGISQIAFVKTSDRVRGTRQAIEMLGHLEVTNKNIFIKPNYNSSDPAPGSTHPDILKSIVTMLRDGGAGNIKVGDRSGMGDTRRTMEILGVFQMAENLGFETLVFDEMPAEDWVMIKPPGSNWQFGFPFARPCIESEVIVQACCLKTHRYGGQFTMSLKNSVGMVAKHNLVDNHDFMNELHSSPHQRHMIAEINTAYSPYLILLDGVEAFISGGPAKGERVKSEVILAGRDRVAIDAVGVALLRYHGCRTEVANGKIFDQDQIMRAVELGIGVESPQKIDLLTGDSDSAVYANQIEEILFS
ncbi:MAG: DUF362 domain-containing protein [Chloroflexota bacterium]|nr:MAG: DUF362 domain-containing protein [Chloroflexota bacterium]